MCELFDEIREEGIEIGEKMGMKKGRLRGAVEIIREDGRSDADVQKRLIEKYGISKKKALKAMSIPMA